MQILEAFDLTGSLCAAADLAGWASHRRPVGRRAGRRRHPAAHVPTAAGRRVPPEDRGMGRQFDCIPGAGIQSDCDRSVIAGSGGPGPGAPSSGLHDLSGDHGHLDVLALAQLS